MNLKLLFPCCVKTSLNNDSPPPRNDYTFPESELASVMSYARDADDNELYPKKPPFFILHPQWNTPVYARDASGDETYPVWQGRQVMAETKEGEMLAARYASRRQRYPLDAHGNAYFPLCKTTKNPYYLLDENGYAYQPKTVNGHVMALHPEDLPEEGAAVYDKRDALGSIIYTEDHKMRRRSTWTRVKEAFLVGICLSLMLLCCR